MHLVRTKAKHYLFHIMYNLRLIELSFVYLKHLKVQCQLYE